MIHQLISLHWRMKQFLISIPLILFFSMSISGQTPKAFTNVPATFVEEFTNMMSVRMNDENQLILDEFLTLFQSGVFAEDEQFRIISISNFLLERRARPYPHFRNYIRALSAIKKNAVDQSSYIAWEKGLLDLLEDRRYTLVNLDRFFEVSYMIVASQTLFESAPATWKFSATDYRMIYDTALYFQFPNTTLTCYAQRDSIMILNTRGLFDASNITWYGNTGRVTWERAGFLPQEVFADLNRYQIDMTTPYYSADSVLFTHTGYFSEPLNGGLSDRARRISNPIQATYPVFTSFTEKFVIRDLYPNIDFEGGLSMEGATVKGTGDEYNPAKMNLYRQDTLKMIVKSGSFQIRGEQIISSENQVTIYLEEDSIIHPNIAFRYNVSNKEVTLYQTDNPITGTPYYNSYHKVDMNFDQLIWKMEEPIMRLTMARGNTMGEARFKSSSFYNSVHYDRMQGMDTQHPLWVLKRFAEWYYSEEFPVKELADWMNKPIHQIQRLIMRLALDGFVFYDPESDVAIIKPQLYDYIDAHAGTIDYDVIDFISNTRAPQDNAILNLNNNELTINGIPRIFLSDSQNVGIVPMENRIVLKKNRDFKFGGRIQAGLLNFYGENFTFDYDSFKVDLKNIDSLNLSVLTDSVDAYGAPIIQVVENNIENITGELFIDDPMNKSGLEDFPEYPQFRSTTNSYVYYDVTAGMDSTIYPRDEFYYKLNPFSVSNLTELTRNDLRFNGEFIAGDIFPTLQQDLLIQDDMSLGFMVDAPPEGLPTYGDKAVFYNQISLNNRGIQGIGTLNYLTSTTISDNFRFYPDSMLTKASSFTLERDSIDSRYPNILAQNVDILWYPDEDEMFISQTSDILEIFDEETYFAGDLKLTPEKLYGSGTLYLSNSEIESNQFEYGDVYAHADTADFRIKSEEGVEYAIVAEKMNANLNIEEKEAFFNALVDTIPVKFPEKEFISSVDLLIWDMEFDRLDMVNENERNDAYKLGSYLVEDQWEKIPTFISTNVETDSLGFESDSAIYRMDDHSLTAYYVDYIEVADALIFPGGGSLTIEQKGLMKGFTNARVVANGVHEIDAENINILSRKRYYGTGYYNYIDEDKSLQRIHFADITVDDLGHTHAEGELTEADTFRLSPFFSFEGQVILDAERQNLEFNGGTRLKHNCADISQNLIAFTAEIDPLNVRIPVPAQPVAPNGVRIYNGIYVSVDSSHIYGAYFSKRKEYSDVQISTAEGYLIFDKPSGQYRIAGEEKLINPEAEGNMLALDRNFCRLLGEGRLDLSIDVGQMKLKAAGTALHDMEANVSTFDLMLGMDFFFSDEAIQIMAREVNAIPTLRPVDMSSKNYKIAMVNIGGRSAAQSMDDESMLLGLGQIPAELKHTILITQLTLQWNQETSSYISDGSIGIGNINGIPVNRQVEGFIEIQKRRTGDIMDVYLQLDERTWYYFGYTRGVMQAFSSNRDFRELLTEIRTNQRQLNVPSGQTPYTYMVASDRKYSNFRRRMRMIMNDEDIIEEQ